MSIITSNLKMLKIYSDPNHYFPKDRFSLNNITKLIWQREGSRQGLVQPRDHDHFQYEPDINKSDVCLLTMSWSYYVRNNIVNLAELEVSKANTAGKRIVFFSNNDHPANLPFSNVILFESGGYKSRNNYFYHTGYPYFTKDYIKLYKNGESTYRKKQSLPVVGFCGHVSQSMTQNLWHSVVNNLRKIKYRVRLTEWEPPPFEYTNFRRKVLKQFSSHPGVQTNYVLRDKNRAGDEKINVDHNIHKKAFIRNVLESDYTVCVRGYGNYSIRFYETLCLGRIPIFIDTDCLLPFQEEIEYQNLFPWIGLKDLPYSAEILRDFHSKLTDADFVDLQFTCRKMWLEHMTYDGFYRDFVRKMRAINKIEKT